MSGFPSSIGAFETVVILDSEYVAERGEPYDPVALGVQVHGKETVLVYGRDEMLEWRQLPFPIDKSTLMVCFNAGAESGFLHALGEGMPPNTGAWSNEVFPWMSLRSRACATGTAACSSATGKLWTGTVLV